MTALSTPAAPTPLGHYRQGMRVAGLVYMSGQLPIVPGMQPDNQAASFEQQAELVLRNFLAVVAAAGACREDVVKVTAYVVGSMNWPTFNRVFAEAFGEHRPARSVVPVPELHHGYLIEIDGVALEPAAA
ncbi:reactive intermediate/imine deaminase [Methylobacterium radiodurans]|uniref:Reactive intermediate/imine deaminase n=2 Tax=Methylobacterium radiodurans TaxID=2202828 RepID=A0A2U8VZG1_9HYPH|nr:reactive intermediate/imine deaminase [Methylobacterium radiodurans]